MRAQTGRKRGRPQAAGVVRRLRLHADVAAALDRIAPGEGFSQGRVITEWRNLAAMRDEEVGHLAALQAKADAREAELLQYIAEQRGLIKELVRSGARQQAKRVKPRNAPPSALPRLVACEKDCGAFLDPFSLAAGLTVCLDCRKTD